MDLKTGGTKQCFFAEKPLHPIEMWMDARSDSG
jgi:hypothetical protein